MLVDLLHPSFVTEKEVALRRECRLFTDPATSKVERHHDARSGDRARRRHEDLQARSAHRQASRGYWPVRGRAAATAKPKVECLQRQAASAGGLRAMRRE